MNIQQKIGTGMIAIPIIGGVAYTCWMDPRGLIAVGLCVWILIAIGLISRDDRPDIPSGRDEFGGR